MRYYVTIYGGHNLHFHKTYIRSRCKKLISRVDNSFIPKFRRSNLIGAKLSDHYGIIKSTKLSSLFERKRYWAIRSRIIYPIHYNMKDKRTFYDSVTNCDCVDDYFKLSDTLVFFNDEGVSKMEFIKGEI